MSIKELHKAILQAGYTGYLLSPLYYETTQGGKSVLLELLHSLKEESKKKLDLMGSDYNY